jgi:AcrR family transcriptional regulator
LPGSNSNKTTLRRRFDAALVARHLKHSDSGREELRGQKVNHILSVAASLFASEGLAGVSMRRVAADAGVTLSTLQHYFGNRQNLVELTINSLLDTYIADFTAISRNTAAPATDRFSKVMDELLGTVDSPVIEAFYVHLWAAAAQDAVILEHIREAYAGYFEALASIVGQMRPDWSVERVTSMALAIGTQIDGLLVTRLIAPPTLPPWDAVVSSIKGFWLDSILRG